MHTQYHEASQYLEPSDAGTGAMQYSPASCCSSATGSSSVTAIPRDKLLNRYESHTKHCKYCSAALKNFQSIHKITSNLYHILAAAAVGVAAVQIVQVSQAIIGAAASQAAVNPVNAAVLSVGVRQLVRISIGQFALAPAAIVLGLASLVAYVFCRWSEKTIRRFIFVDYDYSHISKK